MKKLVARLCRRKEILLLAIASSFALASIASSWVASERMPQSSGEGHSIQRLIDPIPNESTGRRKRQTMAPRESSEQSVGFVHIGKTGGSTISQLLRNGCTSFVTGPCRNITHESAVSKVVVSGVLLPWWLHLV